MKKLIILVLVALIPTLSFSQKKPKNKMKFGKVSIEELKMTTCEIDTTANALVLGEFIKYKFDYIEHKGFQIKTEVYRRIKVLNNEGIDGVGDFEISLYNHNTVGSKVGSFKAYTYNLEGDQIIETKLDRKSKFVSRSDFYVTNKYAFKNVKAGSVLEYKYTTSSDFINSFDTYYPQRDIPVLWSELYVEYYNEIEYKYYVSGGIFPFYQDHGGYGNEIIDTWVYIDIPPIEQESYMRDVENYTAKIDYELLKVEFKGSYYQDYSSSWPEISKDLMKSDHYGGLLKKGRYYKDIIAHVEADSNAKDIYTKVQSALHFIRSNYEWNNNNSYMATYEFNKVISDKKGNSTDLNILLMGALTQLGINNSPVVLSTRNNGILLQSRPSKKSLNYTITSFYIDGKMYVVDAATDYSGINLLPSKCLNENGYVLHETAPKWVSLEPFKNYNKRVFVQATIDEDLVITGVFQTKNIGYASQDLRKDIQEKGGVEKYTNSKIKNSTFSLSEYSIENAEKLDDAIKEKFKFKTDSHVQELGDILGIDPFLFKDFHENPFMKEVRKFPIDFVYPIALDYTYIYSLPEGYIVDELAKPTRVSNEDKTISFQMNSASTGKNITVSLKFQIKEAFFATHKYSEIKSFFDYFIDNQNQMITIKPE